jgi:hypothetical protein
MHEINVISSSQLCNISFPISFSTSSSFFFELISRSFHEVAAHSQLSKAKRDETEEEEKEGRGEGEGVAAVSAPCGP